jgi:hypothetical protein
VDDRDVTHVLLPLKRKQKVSARPCRWPQARRLRMQHRETWLLRRRNPPLCSARRTTSTISSWRNTRSSWGARQVRACSASVERSSVPQKQGAAGAPWGRLETPPKTPPRGGPEVSIREAQWVTGGQGLNPGRRRPARNAPQPGHRLHAGLCVRARVYQGWCACLDGETSVAEVEV